MTQTDTVVETPRPDGEAVLSRGDAVGRYIVLAMLGRGGMGEVYSAYDPELDRRVAVKVIHAAMRAIGSPEKARARLLREAQTLAKLAHPNIVGVYDVGEVGGDVYVAMEFVAGSELGTWSKEETRSPEEILDAFRAAGEGLKAAHDAGLAHRDFKPENVIIGVSGRPRVIDFGIARLTNEASDPNPLSRPQSDALIDELTTNRQISTSLETRVGALVGTPAYMAPEQFLGGAPDARSDQFSFCVALWEALSGSRPFKGKNVADLSAAVLDDEREPLPAEIPAFVARGLTRGLANKPGDRFADMGELLEAIAPPKAKAARPAAIAAIALGAAAFAAVVVFAMTRGQAGDACAEVGDEASEAWSEERREAAAAAFKASGDKNSPEAWARVSETLDGYALSWTEARRDVCRASKVRREESAELSEKRIACLDERLGELRAVVALVGGADAAFVADAVETVDGLAPLSDCSNVARLTGAPEIPKPISEAISRIKALNRARKLKPGIALANEAIVMAKEAGSLAGEGRATYELGRLLGRDRDYDGAVDALFAAIRIADEAGDSSSEAEAWVELVRTVGWRQRKYEESTRWVEHARVAIKQDGSPLHLEARLRENIAWVDRTRGDHASALANFRAAFELFREAGMTTGVAPLRAKAGIASALRSLERHDEALALQREVLRERSAIFGENDPNMSSSHSTLAASLTEKKQYVEARTHYEKAIALRIARTGPNDPGLAWITRNAALLEERVGDYERASELFTRAYDLRLRGKPARDARAFRALAHIARLAGRRGDADRQLELQREVVEGFRIVGSDGRNDLGKSLTTLCALQRRMNLLRSARRSCDEAIEILADAPPDPRDLATALTALARVALDGGQEGDAANHAERALEIRREHASPSRAMTETLFVVATTRLRNRETRRSVRGLLAEIGELSQSLHRGEDDISGEVAALRDRAL